MTFRNTPTPSLVERTQELCANLNSGESVHRKIASGASIDIHAQHNDTYIGEVHVVDTATNKNIHRLATEALKTFGGPYAGSSGSQMSIVPMEDQVRSYRNDIGLSEQKQTFISARQESKAVITTHTPSSEYVTVRIGFGPHTQDELLRKIVRAEHMLEQHKYVARSQEPKLSGAARVLGRISEYIARSGMRVW